MHRIVLTRQPGQAGLLEQELAELNIGVELLPLLDFVLPADTEPLHEERARLAAGAYDWVVLTSPNAVRALEKLGYFSAPTEAKWGMVGGGTAAIFTQLSGRHPDFVAQQQSGEGLVHEFPAPEQGGRNAVLLPLSELAANTVPDGLSRNGYTVSHVTAYRTIHADARIPADRRLLPTVQPGAEVHDGESLAAVAGAITAVVLTSPSNARAYAAQAEDFPALVLPPLLAIGQPTAQAMTALGLPITAVLPKPDARSIYRWILTYLPT